MLDFGDARACRYSGLVRYDEFRAREINTPYASRSESRQAYVFRPALREFGQNPNLPPMGMRVRLSVGLIFQLFAGDQVILRALKIRDVRGRQWPSWFLVRAPARVGAMTIWPPENSQRSI